MSRLFSVIVLCPNGRRETIKISSNSCILQILEEACKKQDLNPTEFDLYHHKKPLDLSLPVRFANLPNNAALELHPTKNERKECAVTIALQLESGERLMGNFSPSSTLFDILKQNLGIDSLNSQEKGEPVCIYMRQKITGDAIKSTTLRSLGLTQGTAIIRLLYREPEKLENQAHVSKSLTSKTIRPPSPGSTYDGFSTLGNVEIQKDSQYKSETILDEKEKQLSNYKNNESEVKGNSLPPYVKNENPTFASRDSKSEIKTAFLPFNDQKTEIDSYQPHEHKMEEEKYIDEKNADVEEMECDSDIKEEPEEIGEINYIGDRHAVLYSLDDITETKKADLPDEFFELTVKEVRYLMEEYKRERIQLENQPLLTKEQRERQLYQKLAGYNKTVIRVYFPEKLVLQADFDVTETVQTVINFLKNYLEPKDLNFYLYTTPPKEKLVNSKTLLESLLVPAAVVHFGCDLSLPTYLQKDLWQKKSDPRAAALASSESRKESIENFQTDSTLEKVVVKQENTTNNSCSTISEYNETDVVRPKSGKIPKWMKLSKK